MEAHKRQFDYTSSEGIDDAKAIIQECYSIVSHLDEISATSKDRIAKLYKLCDTGDIIISKWTEAEMKKRAFLQSDICRLFREPPFSIHKSYEWELLQTSMNKAYDSFISRLTAAYPLNEKELRVSLLLKIGVSPANIALSIPCSRETITSIRRRLSAKHLGIQRPYGWDKLIANF
jgi:DNA-binding CsgD family transcriptional regulator